MLKLDVVLHANVQDSITGIKLLLQSMSDQLELALFPLVPKLISQFNFKWKNDFAVATDAVLDSL